MSEQPEAKQVPLVERLESVPVDARLAVDDGPCSTSFYAVGAMAHEAAAELRRLSAENEELRRCAEVEEVEKYAAANRRLYALNGELLEALNNIASTDPVDAALDPQRAKRIARAAIARAEGQA